MNEDIIRESEMQDMVGRTFRHFKGGLYTVLGFTTDSETVESTVIYRNIETKQVWNRPLANFIEKVTLADGQIVERFKRIQFKDNKTQPK